MKSLDFYFFMHSIKQALKKPKHQPNNNKMSYFALEEKIERQSKIILELEETLHRTKNVVIELVEGLYCHESQQHILHKNLSEITNNNVPWVPDTSEDNHIWGSSPTTSQGNNHEIRIQQLETALSNMINGNIQDVHEKNILKKLREENYELLEKAYKFSEFTILGNKLTYENETKTTIIQDLKNLLENIQPEYKETIQCIMNSIPDNIPNDSDNEPHNDEEGIENIYMPASFNEEDSYINTDPEMDKDIQKLTHENNRLRLICSKVDEMSLKIDRLVHKNQINDTKIQLLKELLKIKHPECLHIYEINEEPCPYI